MKLKNYYKKKENILKLKYLHFLQMLLINFLMTRIWQRSQHWIISKINQSYQRSKVMLCIRGLQPGYRNNIFLQQCSTIIRYLRVIQLRGLRRSYVTAIGRACTALMSKPEAKIYSDKSHVMSVCGICFGGYCVYSFQQADSLCILLAQE